MRYYRTGRIRKFPWWGYAPRDPWWKLVGPTVFMSVGKPGLYDTGLQSLLRGVPSCLGAGRQMTVSARTGPLIRRLYLECRAGVYRGTVNHRTENAAVRCLFRRARYRPTSLGAGFPPKSRQPP